MYKFTEISKENLVDKARYLVVGQVLGCAWSDKMTYSAENDFFGNDRGTGCVQNVRKAEDIKVYGVEIQTEEELDLKEQLRKTKEDRANIVNLLAGLIGKRYREINIEDLTPSTMNGEAVLAPVDWNGKSAAMQFTEFFIDHIKKYWIR